MADDSLAVPDFMKEANGSVFLGQNTSYSGADIKLVMHIYDGGKLAEQRQNDLQNQINDLNSKLSANNSHKTTLQNTLNSNSFTSSDVDSFNSINTQINKQQNTLDYLTAELSRIGKTKPKFSTKVLAECQTLSISTHREKIPIRSFGSVGVKAYARGGRTIAGSMIFTVFDRNVIDEFLESHPADSDQHNPVTTALIDQVSPFDITINFANELGQVSRMTIYGVEFVNEGQTMSIEDLLLENVTQFVARDYDPMRPVAQRKIDENNRLTQDTIPIKASSLLSDQDYQNYRDQLNSFDRFKIRNNPYT